MRELNIEERAIVGGGLAPVIVRSAISCGVGAVGGAIAYNSAKALDGGETTVCGNAVAILTGCLSNVMPSANTATVVATGGAAMVGACDGFSGGAGPSGGNMSESRVDDSSAY